MTPQHQIYLTQIQTTKKLTIGFNAPYSLSIFTDLAALGLVREVGRNDYGVTFKAI